MEEAHKVVDMILAAKDLFDKLTPEGKEHVENEIAFLEKA